MKIKNGFVLVAMGDEHVAVAVDEAQTSFNGIMKMNKTGAWLWEQLKEDITEEALVARMCETYEGLDADTAKRDLEEYLGYIEPALER